MVQEFEGPCCRFCLYFQSLKIPGMTVSQVVDEVLYIGLIKMVELDVSDFIIDFQKEF